MEGISIVIPTYNSSSTLDACLDSIDGQTLLCKDLIVVDRFSVDQTVRVAQAHHARVIQSYATRSVARNLGARASNSFGILFIDSDMILQPTLVQECTKLLLQFDSLVVPEASIGKGFWALCKRLERERYIGDDSIEAPRCYRREPFLAIGGYDENLEAGEDWELRQRSARESFKIGRTQSMLLHDEGEYSPSIAFRRKFAYGRTINRYVRKNPSATLLQVNPLIRVLDPSLKIMSHDLRHGLGVLILRTVEFTGAGMGFLSTRFENPAIS
jgi:glycosyltransferase involved in cell wall biosynthesis